LLIVRPKGRIAFIAALIPACAAFIPFLMPAPILSPIAQENEGETKNLALNLNEITEQFIITAVFDDEVADKLNKANSINKEIAAERLETIFKSQDLVELKYGSRTDKGFIQQMTITENAKDDSKHYDVKIRFLKAEKMDTN